MIMTTKLMVIDITRTATTDNINDSTIIIRMKEIMVAMTI